MRTLYYLSQVFLLLLLLTSCGDKGDDPTPSAGTATFRVDILQSGDYSKFVRIVTVKGGDIKYRGTNDKVPAVLLEDDLNKAVISLEATNVAELEIETHTEFLSVETGPATMGLKFIVYKNDKLLEEKAFTYTEATKGKAEVLTYKAN